MATLISERLAVLVLLREARLAEEILTEVERGTQGLVTLRVDALRVVLSNMEREGLVVHHERGNGRQGQRPPKRYVLTERGREEARKVLATVLAFLTAAESSAQG